MSEQSGNSPDACIYCETNTPAVCFSARSMTGQDYTLCQCLHCGTYFLNPSPTPEQLQQAYDNSYYGSREAKFSPWIELCLEYFRQSRSRKVRRVAPPRARILDIGCGNGKFLGYLIKDGYEGYGVELPGPAVERARKIAGLRLKEGPLKADDFPEHFFDVVTLWHVFEHLPRPKQALEIIYHILKPGGYLFISMPNIQSWQGRLFCGNWLHLDPPRHLFFVNPENLIEKLKEWNFSLKAMNHFSLEQNVFGWQQSLLNGICRKREVLFEALKGNRDYIADYSSLNLGIQKAFYMLSFPLFILLAVLEAAAGAGGTFEAVFVKEENADV